MITRVRIWKIIQPTLKIFTYSLGGLVIGLLLLILGFDIHYKTYAFKGLSVAGIEVGGLSKGDMIEHLRSHLNLEALNSNIVLEFEGNRWELPLYRIDAYVDIERSVEEALESANSMPFYKRWLKRISFQSIEEDIPLCVRYDPVLLDSFVKEMKGYIDREPVDAAIKLEGRRLVFVNSRSGWKIDADELREAIIHTLSREDRVAKINIKVTPPKVSDNQIGKVIAVDTTNHILTLFNNMQVEKQYPIACGQPAWPTPLGTYKVTAKLMNPAWVNPGSSWAASMPPYIPPGPGNPLGTRALATSAPGVLIHGTYSSWSIGRSVSHGCIRMYIKDSEDIFNRVSVGTPVLIY